MGMHLRAAGNFVKVASRFQSSILVSSGSQGEVNGKSIIGVIGLAAEHGSVLKVRAEGEDEQEAVKALEELVADGFGLGEPS